MKLVKVKLYKIRCVDIKPIGQVNRDSVGYGLYPIFNVGRCVDDGGRTYLLPPGCTLYTGNNGLKIETKNNFDCDIGVARNGFPQIMNGQFAGFILPLSEEKI